MSYMVHYINVTSNISDPLGGNVTMKAVAFTNSQHIGTNNDVVFNDETEMKSFFMQNNTIDLVHYPPFFNDKFVPGDDGVYPVIGYITHAYENVTDNTPVNVNNTDTYYVYALTENDVPFQKLHFLMEV
jgi:hypothetical protein